MWGWFGGGAGFGGGGVRVCVCVCEWCVVGACVRACGSECLRVHSSWERHGGLTLVQLLTSRRRGVAHSSMSSSAFAFFWAIKSDLSQNICDLSHSEVSLSVLADMRYSASPYAETVAITTGLLGASEQTINPDNS